MLPMLRLLNDIVDISSDILSLNSADRDGLTLSASSWCWHQQQSLNMWLSCIPAYDHIVNHFCIPLTKWSKGKILKLLSIGAFFFLLVTFSRNVRYT